MTRAITNASFFTILNLHVSLHLITFNLYNYFTNKKTSKTSSPKGNDRSPESQQVKSQKYFEYFSSERAIVFFKAKELQCQQSESARNQNLSSFKQSHIIVTSNFDADSHHQSKMTKLAWRHHFPIISMLDIFRHSRAANSIVSGLILRNSNSSFYACPRYLQV